MTTNVSIGFFVPPVNLHKRNSFLSFFPHAIIVFSSTICESITALAILLDSLDTIFPLEGEGVVFLIE